MPTQSMRFGLVGTGHWARITHAPALASTNGIEFTAVWGRDPLAADALAAQYQVSAHTDVDAFLSDVDAVAFAVPPDVQAALATRVADAGKHILLEKPIATAQATADQLARVVADAGVASVVFFTSRFQADVRAWLTSVTSRGGWAGAAAVWLGTALGKSDPFNTPWRREKGGLWDLAPHAVSLLWACMGPVASVNADAGQADITHLVLHHHNGATSTVTVTLSVPESAAGFDLYLWGEAGRSVAPAQTSQPVVALRTALTELADNARSGCVLHPCDAQFGRDVGRVLADAQRQIDALARR
jgi:predicted dehydrogenase